MIDKKSKNEILNSIKDKDERIVISNILDKAIKFEKTDSVYFTNFLNLNELYDVCKILDYFSIKYSVFAPYRDIEKKNIAFIPSYLENDINKIFVEHVSCIKISLNCNVTLLHKDYMGAIYSLGVKREFIGDIIVKGNIAYFFCMKSVEEYFMYNLSSVGKYEVTLDRVDILSDEIKSLSLNFIEKDYIIPSLRVDAMLSEVYNLSRSDTKEKIVKGDLFINDRNIFYPNTLVKKDDIVSFKKCGKLKVGEVLRNTKSGNLVIKIYKYN